VYERYFGRTADPGVNITQRALARLLRRKRTGNENETKVVRTKTRTNSCKMQCHNVRNIDPGARSLFDEAQAEVFVRLGDLYASFLRSDEHERALDRMTFTSFGVNDNFNEHLALARAEQDSTRTPVHTLFSSFHCCSE
jgi:hypothetical protein